MAGRRERRKKPGTRCRTVQSGRLAAHRLAGWQLTARGGCRCHLSEACPNSSGQGSTARGAHRLLWWPQHSSQHSTHGVQAGQAPCDASPADRRQEVRTARNPHFGGGSGAGRSWAAECGGYRRSGKGKRGTVDFDAAAAWMPSVPGTVRGGLLHPAFAGVSQVLICVFLVGRLGGDSSYFV